MTIEVSALRAEFPSLTSGLAHFDGPGGTQTPAVVGQAIARTLTGPLSNRGTLVASERNAESAVSGFRIAVADLLGASPEGIVYGRSATQIAYDFSRTLAKTWKPVDQIVVSGLDHDSNIRPWLQAAETAGVTVRWIPFDPGTAELDLSAVDEIINERTRLVAVTAASNLLGTMPPVARIAARAHEVGALVYVDGVHYTAHAAVDVKALGADFFTCSPYKFFGPHCAALAAEPGLLETLKPDKLLPSTDNVPERFELGTLPYEIMAGTTAAVDFIARLAPDKGPRRERLIAAHHLIEQHEVRLRQRIEEGLADLGDRITIHSTAAERTPTLFFTFRDKNANEVSQFLAEQDILAPAGSFYAHEPFQALRLAVDAGMRIGLAPYNDDAEIDRLITALSKFL
ncbi:cysteine desulfurase-like protein [Arthrobacter sp. CAU 1506]|uniref:cysteine desulfurase-like protein n=1 Tax=Arthrobacter sp. CAU 1506 TaxID=2560052 RepID=UPI0010ACD556|nr:cysteine desulfurase-like protein [Arthrobacter sp. CAU 1506]TJY70469.1 cysteine desulfurase-like protein [Arthrobacter sp. CAU 1506]